MNQKRVAIIGSGPAGLFAAKIILENADNIEVLVIEQGASPEERSCPSEYGKNCQECRLCSVLCGGGGAGLFSDGKLIEDLKSGGNASAISKMNAEAKAELIKYIEDTLVSYDGVSTKSPVPSEQVQNFYKKKFEEQGLDAKYYPVLHMGTANLVHIIGGFLEDLKKNQRYSILFKEKVVSICRTETGFLLKTNKSNTIAADFVIAAVGKTGADWLKETLTVLGCRFDENNFYFGLRLEMPDDILAPLAELSFDPKIWSFTKDGRKIKTHCMCRQGKIRMTKYGGLTVAGGHSVYTEKNKIENSKRSNRGNMNILMEYSGNHRAEKQRLINNFKRASEDKLLVQTLGDFREDQSTDIFADEFRPMLGVSYKAGNIRSIIGDENYARAMLDFIDALGTVFPGMNNSDNLLYGPAFEWCMDAVIVSENMETSVPDLFAVGDGAGLSQGIVYSASTGIQAANEIVKRCI